MAIQFETTNKVRGPSVIRIHGVGTANINVQNTLSSTSTTENITGFAIQKCAWSTNASIMIRSSGQDVLELHGQGQIDFDDEFVNIANTGPAAVGSQFLQVTIATGGTVLLRIAKEATYSPALTGQ
tara:strand:- start:3393 stop:3770 length:378 start_codon:yes stop_codon:yes gene_type:complete